MAEKDSAMVAQLIAISTSHLEYIERLEDRIIADGSELAAQRRTIATLRARLQRGGTGRQYRHSGPIKWQSFDVLMFGYSQCYHVWEAKRLHEKRIAAIRNFGALPSGPACWMCSHDSTRGQMTKDDTGPIHYECARLLAEFAADSGLEEEASAFLMRCK